MVMVTITTTTITGDDVKVVYLGKTVTDPRLRSKYGVVRSKTILRIVPVAEIA